MNGLKCVCVKKYVQVRKEEVSFVFRSLYWAFKVGWLVSILIQC